MVPVVFWQAARSVSCFSVVTDVQRASTTAACNVRKSEVQTRQLTLEVVSHHGSAGSIRSVICTGDNDAWPQDSGQLSGVQLGYMVLRIKRRLLNLDERAQVHM